MVLNVHNRILKASVSDVGKILDGLASNDDKLWPRTQWPAMKFDRKIQKGAIGGHGPVRYLVENYIPSRSIIFRFTSPKGFDGIHGFYIEEIEPNHVKIEHRIEMILKGFGRFSWPIVFMPLHNALIEDALDNVEVYLNSKLHKKRSYSNWVRFLRWVLSKNKQRSKG